MPTLLDVLHILGRSEAADAIQLTFDGWATSILQKTLDSEGARRAATQDLWSRWLTPSPGYEPFLVKQGWSPAAARSFSTLVVDLSRRQFRESQACRSVSEDIKFIREPGRQRAALIRRIKQLHTTFEENCRSISKFLFDVGILPSDFFSLTQCAAKGDHAKIPTLLRWPQKLRLPASLKKGLKITPSSYAYEFFLADKFGLLKGTLPKADRNRAAEYVNSLTEATRKEFGEPNFDPRPAQRRAKRLIKKEYVV